VSGMLVSVEPQATMNRRMVMNTHDSRICFTV
jgi:hypothetical protein